MLPVLLAHHSPYLMEKKTGSDQGRFGLCRIALVWQSLGWPSVEVALPQQANCGAQLEKIEWTPNRDGVLMGWKPIWRPRCGR